VTECGRRNEGGAPWFLMLVVLAVLGLAVVAGCGDDDEGGSAAAGSGGTETSDVDNSAVQDKQIGYIDVIEVAAIEKRWSNAFKYAADKIGWEVQVLDAAGDPTKALNHFRNLTNSGVDAIVGSSIAAEWVRPAASAAKANDIALVQLITKASPGVWEADIDEDATAYSTALAERIKEDFPDGAKVGVLIEGVIPAEQQRLQVLEEQFAGSNIEIVATKDIPLDDQPSAQKATVDVMNAEPDIDVLISVSSVLVQYMLPGLRTAGQEDVKVYSWYADSINAKLLQSNPQFVAVVDSDIAKASFIAIDELLKRFSGEEMTPQQNVDVEPKIVTKDDLNDAIAADQGPVPYEELIAPYLEEWQSTYGLGS
jgi:ABC-type sugar transport system substrate-binding protein